MECHVCELHARGDTAQATVIEQVRAQRITHAILAGGARDADWVAAELTECGPCVTRLATIAITMNAASLAALVGGQAKAVAFLEESIAHDLAQQAD